MGRRAVICVVAVAFVVLPTASRGAPDGGSTVCTWGGTPADATGTVTIKPGLTHTPSASPVKIVAVGDMECSDGFAGKVTFDGVIHAGGTCAVQVFEGKIKGLPGVDRAYGPGAGGLVQEFLYDGDGNVVGADQPQVLSGVGRGGSELSDCNTSNGFTDAIFSSTVEIWG